MQERNSTSFAPEIRERMYAALSEHIGSVPSRPITDIHGQTEDHDTRGPTAPTFTDPPIDYDGKWAETLKGSTRSLAAILGMPDTSKLWALWFENQASREILEEWASSGSSSDYIGRGASFPSMWRFLGPGKEVIQGPNPPQASDLAFGDNVVDFKSALKLWYLYRLMEAVPELHRKSDLEAFKIDAYDLYNADKVLSFFKRRHGENKIGDSPPKAFFPCQLYGTQRQ